MKPSASRYPRKDRYSRTGSSLRGSPVLSQLQAELARATKPHDRLAKEQSRLERSLFTKAELRRPPRSAGRSITNGARRASRPAAIRCASTRSSSRPARSSNACSRATFRNIGNGRRCDERTCARTQKLTQQTQAASLVVNANIDWDAVLELVSTAQAFVPPFTTFDVQTLDRSGFVVSDESFARPNIGHMINNFAYDQDESTSIVGGLLGILPIESAASLVSCGVAFTTPSAGRLKISADMQNIYNRIKVLRVGQLRILVGGGRVRRGPVRARRARNAGGARRARH